MARVFKKGDKVEWNSHGGKGVGTVERKITSDTEAAGREVRAGVRQSTLSPQSGKTRRSLRLGLGSGRE